MLDLLSQTWPWYISGPLIGLTVPLLLLAGNKQLGISSTLRHICSACLPSKLSYLNYNWKEQSWSLVFAAGLIIGGLIGEQFLTSSGTVQITSETKTVLQSYGISEFKSLLPRELFNLDNLFTINGLSVVILGGFLVGFGTRYANGCTSGHSIMGLANLKFSSLIATISFFGGGLLMTHLIFPYIFG